MIKICLYCGKEYEAFEANHRGGQNSKYCSPSCASKNWYHKQPLEKIRRINRQRTSKYSRTPRGKYWQLLNSAKKRNIKFNINIDEFAAWYERQSVCCHYCGVNLNGGKTHRIDGYNKSGGLTVDRKDGNMGYTLENMTLCCRRCNTIKNNFFSELEMLQIAETYIKPKLGGVQG